MFILMGLTLSLLALMLQLTLFPPLDLGLVVLSWLIFFDQTSTAVALIFFLSLGLGLVTLTPPGLMAVALAVGFLADLFLKKYWLHQSIWGLLILFAVQKTVFYFLTRLGVWSLSSWVTQLVLVGLAAFVLKRYQNDEKIRLKFLG